MNDALREKSTKLMEAFKGDSEFPKMLKKQNARVMKEMLALQKELGVDLLDEVIKDFVRIAATKNYDFTYEEAKTCIQYQNDIQAIKSQYTLPDKYFEFVDKAKGDPTFETYLKKSYKYINKLCFTTLLENGKTVEIEAQVIPDFIKLAAKYGVEFNEDEAKEFFKAQFKGMEAREK